MHILCISSRKSSFAIGDSEPTLSTWPGVVSLYTHTHTERVDSAFVVVIFIQIFREQSIIIQFYRNVLPLWLQVATPNRMHNAQRHMFATRSFSSFQFSILLCRILFILCFFLSTALLSAYRLTHYGSTFRLFHYFIRFCQFFPSFFLLLLKEVVQEK